MKNRCMELSLLLLIVVLLPTGCSRIITEQVFSSPPPPPEALPTQSPPTPVEEKPFTHKVRWPGETLNRISRWYTGSGRNWPAIVEANPALDPRRIMIGDLIIIPRHLLKTHEQMAKDYRTPGAVKEKTRDTSPAPQSSASQTVDLFGPIDSAELDSSSKKIEAPLPLESLE